MSEKSDNSVIVAASPDGSNVKPDSNQAEELGAIIERNEVLPSNTLEQRLQKLLVNLEKSGLGTIKTDFSDKLETIRKNLVYNNEETFQQGIFSIKKEAGKEDTIILPANLTECLGNSVLSIILTFIVQLSGFKFMKHETEILPTGAFSEEQRKFFLGLFNRLDQGVPDQGFNFSASAKNPQERGRACADCEILLAHKNVPGRIFNYLPMTVRTGSGGKILTSELHSLFGMKNLQLSNRLAAIISLLAKQHINSESAEKAVLLYKVPISEIVRPLTKKHKIKQTVNGKIVEKLVAIHLTRPSKVIECVTDFESQILQTLEGPWDMISKLTNTYKEGLSISEIQKFEDSYKQLYSAQIQNSQQIASWRRMRRELFAEFLPKGRQSRQFKISDIPAFLQWCSESISDKKMEFPNLQSFDIPKLAKSCSFTLDSRIDRILLVNNLLAEGSLKKIFPGITQKLGDEILKCLSWIPDNSDLAKFIGLQEVLYGGLIEESYNSADEE